MGDRQHVEQYVAVHQVVAVVSVLWRSQLPRSGIANHLGEDAAECPNVSLGGGVGIVVRHQRLCNRGSTGGGENAEGYVPGLMKHGVPHDDDVILLVVARPKSATKTSISPLSADTRIFSGLRSR